jgi:hypothetical protein
LLTVVFIQFPAALLGVHITDTIAVTLYGLSLALVNAAGTGVWLYGMKCDLRLPGVPDCPVRFVAVVHSGTDRGLSPRGSRLHHAMSC